MCIYNVFRWNFRSWQVVLLAKKDLWLDFRANLNVDLCSGEDRGGCQIWWRYNRSYSIRFLFKNTNTPLVHKCELANTEIHVFEEYKHILLKRMEEGRCQIWWRPSRRDSISFFCRELQESPSSRYLCTVVHILYISTHISTLVYVTLINTNKMLSLKMVEKKDEEKYQNRPEM